MSRYEIIATTLNREQFYNLIKDNPDVVTWRTAHRPMGTTHFNFATEEVYIPKGSYWKVMSFTEYVSRPITTNVALQQRIVEARKRWEFSQGLLK